jgi:aminopeptidase
MRRITQIAGLTIAIVAVLGACQRESAAPSATARGADAAAAEEPAPAAEPARSTAATDLEQLATRVITQSAAVKEGDVVLIGGRMADAELMENLAVAARKAGAFPLVTYSSDRLSKRLFFDVPAKYDSQSDALGLKLAEIADVTIEVSNATTENLFEGADPARVATRTQAFEPVQQAFARNNVRAVELGNGLYPASWRAKRMGLSEEALADLFWKGVNVDYTQLQARGEEVHVTHPNGTDLKFSVQGRPVLASDGVASEADLKRGGGALSQYLPAGEVYTTPVPGSGEGKLVQTRGYFRGKQIDDLTLTFSGGELTAMTGSGPGFAAFKAEYDAVDDKRKTALAFLDFGINPNISLPADAGVGTWVPAGSVTLGTGSNVWAGGDNSVPYSLVVHLPGSTVTLDGKPVVEQGALKL